MSFINTLRFIVKHPLSRGRRIRSVVGYVKWQIGSRLVPGPIAYEWVNGSRFLVQADESGLTGNVYCGLQEFSDMAYVLHIMTPQDLFVDAGANMGSYTILACAAKGAQGCCLEPVPSTYQRLMDNIRLNNLSNRVKAFNVGLSDKEGELVFTCGENCTNHVVTEGEEYTGVGVRMQVLPLDAVLEGQFPSVLKLDVEGFEVPVLRGAQMTLSNSSLHSVIVELNGSGSRYGFNEDAILKIMQDHGFSPYVYEPFSRALISLDGKNSLSENTLFVRDEKTIKAKLVESARIQIGNVLL